MEEFGGFVPRTREELQGLPGVGRKTANVWLNCALGLPTIAVDTHVFRVANRIGLCKTKTVDKTEAALEKEIPARWKRHAHHWLILHGRYVCKARRPECPECLIRDLWRVEGRQRDDNFRGDGFPAIFCHFLPFMNKMRVRLTSFRVRRTWNLVVRKGEFYLYEY